MATELVVLAIILVSFGGLFLWVARSMSSSLTKGSTGDSASQGLLLPKNCYDLCRQDSGQNSNACPIACSLLQD